MNLNLFFNEKIYILLDSWYTSKEVIKTAKDRGFDIIGGVKSKRVENGQTGGVLSSRSWQSGDSHLEEKKGWIECFILCTDTSLSNEEILRYYYYRWDIETFYLYCKDRLGLGHYQMRKMKAIEKFCALVFSAFCYVEALRFRNLWNNESSIGQSRRYFR